MVGHMSTALYCKTNFHGRVEPVQFIFSRTCGILVEVKNMNRLLASVNMPTDTVYDTKSFLIYFSLATNCQCERLP